MNDSIVLIDFINARVRAGMPIGQAIEEAGTRRFRPVLLTTGNDDRRADTDLAGDFAASTDSDPDGDEHCVRGILRDCASAVLGTGQLLAVLQRAGILRHDVDAAQCRGNGDRPRRKLR